MYSEIKGIVSTFLNTVSLSVAVTATKYTSHATKLKYME